MTANKTSNDSGLIFYLNHSPSRAMIRTQNKKPVDGPGVMKNWVDQVTMTMPDDMSEMGYAANLEAIDKKERKKAKKCLTNHKRAMCKLKLTVASNIISSIIKETKLLKRFPLGRPWAILAGMYRMYRGISMLDHVQLDREKLMIKTTNNKHPDKVFERMFTVKKKYVHRDNGIQPTMPQLIACVINESSDDYKAVLMTKLLTMKGENDYFKIVEELKEVGNELHTAMHNNKEGGSSTTLTEGET